MFVCHATRYARIVWIFQQTAPRAKNRILEKYLEMNVFAKMDILMLAQ